jgi:phage-related minor tail protein
MVHSGTNFTIRGGEEGSEAIMPLGRDSQGNMGVKMIGGAQSSSGLVIQNVYITVTKDDGESSEQASDRAFKQLRREMFGLVEEKLQDAKRPGNSLNPVQRF